MNLKIESFAKLINYLAGRISSVRRKASYLHSYCVHYEGLSF